MRRPLLALVLAIAAIGVFTAAPAALLHTPPPPRRALRRRAHGVEQRRLGGDRHQLHGAHPEPPHGVVADEDEIRRGARHDGAPHLVRGGPKDGAPDAGGERREQGDEEQRDENAPTNSTRGAPRCRGSSRSPCDPWPSGSTCPRTLPRRRPRSPCSR